MSDEELDRMVAALRAVGEAGALVVDMWSEVCQRQPNREPRSIWLARPENAAVLTKVVTTLTAFEREFYEQLGRIETITKNKEGKQIG